MNNSRGKPYNAKPKQLEHEKPAQTRTARSHWKEMQKILAKPSTQALLLLLGLALLFWGRVLFGGQSFLPGAALEGFAPFGGKPDAPWTILHWDALAQYFPWRHFAAQELQHGRIPLWNPFQFTGTPFLANAQSALFYPPNIVFWLLPTAYAFGLSAFFHTLLALFSTYFLCQNWGQSRAASVIAATAFGFCGFLMSWVPLPTIFSTASWLPLLLLLFERASDDETPGKSTLFFALTLACALLAGHAQIFFYLLLALGLRQPFLHHRWRGLAILTGATCLGLALSAAQLLPTLEMARIGHRAGGPPTPADWEFWLPRALGTGDFSTLVFPDWPSRLGTLNENFGFMGFGVLTLAFCGLLTRKSRAPKWFAFSLGVLGLLYAMATPLAQFFYFGIPGVSQMGGTGRALLLWSLGAAILCGFGVDFLREKWKLPILVPLVGLIVCFELGLNAWLVQPSAPLASIYPRTQLTDFLAAKTAPHARVLFFTDKRFWRPTEYLRPPQTHPGGILPPNGATVYRIYDVNGYDSLSLGAFRRYIASEENGSPSPDFNGNMMLLNNLNSPVLAELGVRFLALPEGSPGRGRKVFEGNGVAVWQIEDTATKQVDGRAFAPGFRNGRYEPESFRLGVFIALCALGFVAFGLAQKGRNDSHYPRHNNPD